MKKTAETWVMLGASRQAYTIARVIAREQAALAELKKGMRQ